MKLGLAMLAVSAAAGLAPAAARAETACAELAKTALPHAQVTAAQLETLPSGQACRIEVTSRPTPDSDIGIEVLIPVGAAWNGKFVQLGNGGLGGVIPVAAIKARASAGYAAAGTDDGHRADNHIGSWAEGHPEKLRDYAIRSLKETTVAGKALVAAMKGEAARRSYFVGCSAGGREALMEAQRFPDDFDGIVAGAAANYYTLQTGGRAYIMQALAKPGAYLGPVDLQLLQSAALRTCADGGAFIRDQLACGFDPAALACKTGQSQGCLTGPQIAAAHALYGGRPGPDGKPVFPAYTPGADAAPGSFQAWITGTSSATMSVSNGYMYASQAMKYFIYGDPAFDMLKADVGAKFDRDRRAPARLLDAVDPDLSAFRKHGGKLIQYHGWNDPAVPPLGSIRYQSELRRAMGDIGDFHRLYMIPGMLHCGGGAGPSGVDWLGLLDRWVEDKAAPAELTASAPSGETQTLCPYPGVADGSGACRRPRAKS